MAGTVYGFVLNDGRLDLRVERGGVVRFVATRYEVREREWDAETGWLAVGNVVTSRHRKLLCYQRGMARDMRMMRAVINEMERTRPRITADDIASAYRRMAADYQMLSVWAQTLADETARENRPRTARGYLTAMRRFIDFNRGYDICLDVLTAEVVAMFENALEREGLTPPTISFYMRSLRAIYNKAVSENIIPAPSEDPFEEAYTFIDVPLKHISTEM